MLLAISFNDNLKYNENKIKNKKIWAHYSVNLNEIQSVIQIYSLLLSPINNANEHYLNG